VAENKTQKNTASVASFIKGIDDDQRRSDCKEVVAMMAKATKARPAMWGPAIIGFGDHEYFGASGKATKWFKVGVSPRKQALSLYLMGGKDKELLGKLGPSKTYTKMVSGCLYINNLDEVHRPTLQKLIVDSVSRLKARKK
jgi:hypothetical protein